MSRRKQPQRLPPPIMQGGGTLDSEIVLREYQGELGVLLWKTVRSVRMWAELPEGERVHAYESMAAASRAEAIARAGVPDEISGSLSRAAGVLQPRSRTAIVARACQEIADWAADSGNLGTAMEFMQAAAVVLPADAEIAHQVARLARTAAEYHRAESWYRQAIGRARRAHAWSEFSRSYIGLGTVYTLRGSYPQAGRNLIRGLRAARRFSLKHLVAAAAHELVILGIRTDRPGDVTRYGRLAVEAYGAGHPRLPALAHDIGIFLLNAGYFDAAFRVIHATPRDFGGPTEQLARSGAMVRAAAILGNRKAYGEALAQSEALLSDPRTAMVGTEVYYAIAQGADLIGDRERAINAARQARDLSFQRGESWIQFAAESLLESLEKGEVAQASAAAPVRTPRQIGGLVVELETAIGALQPA